MTSREEAARRLAAMRSEKERVLSLLHLRELSAARKVKEEEKASIATIKRMWDNDVKLVESARADLKEKRVAYEMELKEHRLAEKDIAALFEHRKNELQRAAARLSRHHDAAVMQKKARSTHKNAHRYGYEAVASLGGYEKQTHTEFSQQSGAF